MPVNSVSLLSDKGGKYNGHIKEGIPDEGGYLNYQLMLGKAGSKEEREKAGWVTMTDREENQGRWLELEYITSLASKSSPTRWRHQDVTIPKIGAAMMEVVIARALDWDSKYQGIMLNSLPERVSWYWDLGFRFDPDRKPLIHDGALGPIFDKIRRQERLTENEQGLYEQLTEEEQELYRQKKTEVAKKLSLPEEQLTTQKIYIALLTEEVEKSAGIAARKGEKRFGNFKFTIWMTLPKEAQDAWKDRIFSTPLVVHKVGFIQQLFLECVVANAPDALYNAPLKVINCLWDYCQPTYKA